ncbi:MAG: endonuclease/exonuclease/phosphatase family protein [Bacteriovoracaceae bacterium]|nr:endonuclease/exonuclease/phosphatase family protein [Bacteriovoracaceae bacterium]
MKINTLVSLIFIIVISACSKNGTETVIPTAKPKDPFSTLGCTETGLDDELEVMTWNIQRFPMDGKKTVTEVKKIINSVDMDLIAIQEIKDTNIYNDMVADLENHNGVHGENEYIRLGYIYDTRDLEMIGKPYEIFKDDSGSFPRAPFVAKFKHKSLNITFTAINIHLKCCGGNTNRSRRAKAMGLLKTYLDKNFKNKNVVILGDFNEHLTDTRNSSNLYFPYMDSPNYDVTTLDILDNSDDWSYPGWLSQLDQIIVSNDFVSTNRETKSMPIDRCDSRYIDSISDHRPVFVRITK